MATIGKFFDNFEKFGFSAAEIEASTDRMVRRAFFRTGRIFGGAKDTEGGKWEARKVAVVLFKDVASKKLMSLDDDKLKALVSEVGAIEPGKSYEVDGKNLRLETKVLVWQPCYIVGESVKDGLSKSFLLNTSTTDANNNIVKYQSDVHEWANAHIVDRVLDREWTKALADLLNSRGLIFNEVEYPRKRTDGGTFVVKVLNPFFADTHTA